VNFVWWIIVLVSHASHLTKHAPDKGGRAEKI
jgi:hypothetical protein